MIRPASHKYYLADTAEIDHEIDTPCIILSVEQLDDLLMQGCVEWVATRATESLFKLNDKFAKELTEATFH